MKSHCGQILAILESGASISQAEALTWDTPCQQLTACLAKLMTGRYNRKKYAIERVVGAEVRYRLKMPVVDAINEIPARERIETDSLFTK